MRKKRILMSNESSLLSTGYSTYGHEVLKRLHETGKYEIGELATYGNPEDTRNKMIRWKYYPVVPPQNRKDLMAAYKSKAKYQYGEFIFEDVCIDFRPDIVFDIRDPYVFDYECYSPARKYFKHAIMPTVDSAPQNEDWLPIFMSADALFSYTDWGGKVLMKQSNNEIKWRGSASPAFSKDFEALDKETVKRSFGFKKDDFIIGTVMRNQVRKLYPDLFEAFRAFLSEQEKAPLFLKEESEKSLGERAFLYVHCAWPDVGWDIPSLLKEFGLGNKVYFTYYCLDCNKCYPSFFQDGKTICKYCAGSNATMPGIKTGVSNKALNYIYSSMDLYVQYANCEGFGMPIVEAAASGTPIAAVDYSAMEDLVKNLGGYPIRVERMFRDVGTNAKRALPDNKSFCETIVTHFNVGIEGRKEQSAATRRLAESNYDWDKTAKMWEDYFDSVIPVDKWDEPAKIHTPAKNVPSGMSDGEFVRWAFENVAGWPELADSNMANRLTRDLGLGLCIEGVPDILKLNDNSDNAYLVMGNFTRENICNNLAFLCNKKNEFEQRRFNNASNRTTTKSIR